MSGDSEVANSYHTGIVQGTNYTGGIAGLMSNATLRNSYSSSTISGYYVAGGLIGESRDANIYDSYSHSNVSGTLSTGGLIGYSLQTTSIERSFNSGGVTGQFIVGGLIGNTTQVSITNSYNNGAVNGVTYVGGLFGSVNNITASNYYVSSIVSGMSSVGAVAGAWGGSPTNALFNTDHMLSDNSGSIGKSSAQLKSSATYAGWDLDNIWELREGRFPTLKGIPYEVQKDVAPPILMNAMLTSSAFSIIELTFDEWVAVDNVNGLTVTADGEQVSIVSIEKIDDTTVQLVLEHSVASTATILISIDQELARIKDRAGNSLSTLTAYEVKVELTVVFHSNDGRSATTVTVLRNSLAAEPAEYYREGYTLNGWYSDNGTFSLPFDFTSTPIEDDLNLYAQWIKSNPALAINSDHGMIIGTQPNYEYGQSVELTAVPNEMYIFESWRDNSTGKIVSTNPVYRFTITEDKLLTARFVQEDLQKFTVTFKNESGHVLTIQQVNAGDAAIPPVNPTKPDHTFERWSEDYHNIQSNMTLYPIYKANEVLYHVTVINGTIPSGVTSYRFDSKVTIVADAPDEGMVFSHWESNGMSISYSETYSFYVTGNTTVAAVYAENPVLRQPLVSISPNVIASPESKKLSFIGQVDAAPGYTLVEWGVVVKKSSEPLYELDFTTSGAIRGRSSTLTATGQYMLNKTGVNAGEIWYGRAYLIYQDSSGQIFTLYSSIVQGTIPQ